MWWQAPLLCRRLAIRSTYSLQARNLSCCTAMLDCTPLWVDCDAGADDALGLMLVAKEAQLEGISTVRGNAAAAQVAHNVLRVLTLCSRLEVPVYVGADESCDGEQRPLPEWSGKDGLGDQPDVFPASATITTKPAQGHGPGQLLNAARKYQGNLTVVATGPLTNLAAAVAVEPNLPSLVERVIIMGGSERENSFTKTGAEFNFYCDPEAAQTVIAKFSGKILLFTWESMQRNPLPQEFMQKWTNKASQSADFVNATSGLESYKAGKKEWVPCDPLAFAASINRHIVTDHQDLWCSVETRDVSKRGQTYFDRQQKPDIGSEQFSGVVRLVNLVNLNVFEHLLRCATSV